MHFIWQTYFLLRLFHTHSRQGGRSKPNLLHPSERCKFETD